MIDIKKIQTDARAEIVKEQADRAKVALVRKLRDLASAQNIVRNIEREVADLEASIADGSFI